MRLIDADALIRTMRADPLYFVVERYNIEGPIHAAPTIDAIPVIRCRDCKYCRTYYHGENMPFSYACDKLYLTNNLSSDDYCSRAEREEE